MAEKLGKIIGTILGYATAATITVYIGLSILNWLGITP
jgi:hypothetical protein